MKNISIQDEIKQAEKRYKIEKEIEGVFLKQNYTYVHPICFEDYDSFDFKKQRIHKQSMVKVLNGNSEVLILRPDITTSLMKKWIPNWQQNILKVFYNATVFRWDEEKNIQTLPQMGIEYVGEASLRADQNVIGLAIEVLKRYEKKFILELGSSKYLNALLEEEEIRPYQEEIKPLIYRKSRFALIEKIKNWPINQALKECLSHLLDFQGNFEEVIKKASNYYTNEMMKKALDEMSMIYKAIDCTQKEHIHFDLSMLTEMDYYDGMIFKGYYPNSPKEVISGGRYDGFTKTFGKQVPAVGFCIYMNELIPSL